VDILQMGQQTNNVTTTTALYSTLDIFTKQRIPTDRGFSPLVRKRTIPTEGPPLVDEI
jgi:hypothetical protein